MKKIILICLFGLMVSQTEWTTRVYTTQNLSHGDSFNIFTDLNEPIPEFELFTMRIIDIQGPINTDGGTYTSRIAQSNNQNRYVDLVCDYDGKCHNPSQDECVYSSGEMRYLEFGINFLADKVLTLLITAPFPEEDTGYIEEGFDFCLVEGNNLVAFPCDNPVSVGTAIPELAQAEITQIIGAGVAATNFNGQFVGSLSNFTPASGYWFKSNSNMCFNYTCAE